MKQLTILPVVNQIIFTLCAFLFFTQHSFARLPFLLASGDGNPGWPLKKDGFQPSGWETTSIPNCALISFTRPGSANAGPYMIQGYNYQSDKEFVCHQQFEKQVLWPVMLRLLKKEQKAIPASKFFDESGLQVADENFGELHLMMSGFGSGNSKEASDLNKRVKNLSPSDTIPAEFRCYTEAYQIIGEYYKKGKKVKFKATHLVILWLDPSATMPMQNMYVVPFSEIKSLYNGKPAARLFENLKFPHVLIKLFDFRLQSIYHAIWLDNEVRKGTWDSLPGTSELQKMRSTTEEEWKRLISEQ